MSAVVMYLMFFTRLLLERVCVKEWKSNQAGREAQLPHVDTTATVHLSLQLHDYRSINIEYFQIVPMALK